jgi:predicted nuclease with RNAse H fold
VLELKRNITIGIDLAGKPQNPTGLTVLENRKEKTSLMYTNNQIIESITQNEPTLIAIDAPFSLPKKEFLEKLTKK